MRRSLDIPALAFLFSMSGSPAVAQPGWFCTWGGTEYYGSLGADPGQFNRPVGLSWEAESVLWVVDEGNHRLVQLDGRFEFVRSIGGLGTELGRFDRPSVVSAHPALGGDILVGDIGNLRVQRCGTDCREFASGYETWGIDVSPGGQIFVSDFMNHRILKYDPDGTLVTEWGVQGTAPGEFQFPAGVLVTEYSPYVYLVDLGNHRIQVFDQDGNFQFEFGGSTLGGPVGISDATPCPIPGRGTGAITVTDPGLGEVHLFDLGGSWLATIPRRSGSNLDLGGAVGIAGWESRFVVADATHHRLIVMSQVIPVDGDSWGSVKARYRD